MPNINDFAENYDLNPIFTSDSKKVIYRISKDGNGLIMLANPETKTSEVLISEAEIADKIKQSGIQLNYVPRIQLIHFEQSANELIFSAAGYEWSYDFNNQALKRLQHHNINGVVSYDGKYTVTARDYNLWIVDNNTKTEKPLTKDGSFDKRYGTNYPLLGEIVAKENENPPHSPMVMWSKDNKTILTYVLERNNAQILHSVVQNPKSGRFPKEYKYVYPTAGETYLPLIKPILINVSATEDNINDVTILNVPPQELLYPSNPTLFFDNKGNVNYYWIKRFYGETRFYEIDCKNNNAKIKAKDVDKPLVNTYISSIRKVDSLNGYLTISERSGWAQLYYTKYDGNPDKPQAVTNGKWEVLSINNVIDKNNIFITGNGREEGSNPYFRSLYKVSLGGKIINLTPEPLDHNVTIANDGKYFIDEMSGPSNPVITMIRSTNNGNVIMTLAHEDISSMIYDKYPLPEVFSTMSEDGKYMLYGTIYRPKDFDPNKKYSIIENVYAGPVGHRFAQKFNDNLRFMLESVTRLDAIFVTIDARGTSQRGKEFRLYSYQNLARVGIEDHIYVIKKMAEKYPYMDINRVGVYGSSAGGYDTVRFMLHHPEFYKVGVSYAGNHDLRLDKAVWPEVSMGSINGKSPPDEIWEMNSNIPYAANLMGKLLLVHGDIDDNVPVTATLRLSKALINAGKLHELIILPNVGHAVGVPYYWQALTDFFNKNLIKKNDLK